MVGLLVCVESITVLTSSKSLTKWIRFYLLLLLGCLELTTCAMSAMFCFFRDVFLLYWLWCQWCLTMLGNICPSNPQFIDIIQPTDTQFCHTMPLWAVSTAGYCMVVFPSRESSQKRKRVLEWCQAIAIRGKVSWKYRNIYRNIMKSIYMEIFGNIWKYMEITWFKLKKPKDLSLRFPSHQQSTGGIQRWTSRGLGLSHRSRSVQVMAWSLSNSEMAEVREAFLELDQDKKVHGVLRQLGLGGWSDVLRVFMWGFL